VPATRRAVAMIFAIAAAACPTKLIQASGAVAGTHVSAPGVAAVALGGAWGTAREVPGTAALNLSGFGRVRGVSCASAGNCSAGGFYWAGNYHPFVVSQVSGSWHTAVEVPGGGALNRGGNAELNSVSCASPGNCSAGGYYTGGNGRQAFVASQVKGTWRTAIEVPGTRALNKDGPRRSTLCRAPQRAIAAPGGSTTPVSGTRSRRSSSAR
jgi:hypothetical protein